MKIKFSPRYDQLSQYDSVVLDLLNKKTIEVDLENGKLFGRRIDRDGNRCEVGNSYLNGAARYTILNNGKTVSLYVKRIIYLAYILNPLPNKIVSIKDRNECNLRLDNLILLDIGVASKVRRWSEADKSVVLEMLKTKLHTYAEIGRTVGRTPKAIKHFANSIKCNNPPSKKAWTPENEEILLNLANKGLSPKIIAAKMKKTPTSIYLRLNRMHGWHRSDVHLRDNIQEERFYFAIKGAMQRGTALSYCCICNYSTRIEFHHIDGDRTNNHISNIASLCPNHHVDVTMGQIPSIGLFAIWRRKYSNGKLGPLCNNKCHLVV